MAIKYMLSGLSNSGKTHTIKNLPPEETLVISIDGKKFPFAMPHLHIKKFSSVGQLLYGSPETEDSPKVVGVVTAIKNFKSKYGQLPKYMVFDTVSRISETVNVNCLRNMESREAYSEIAIQIKEFFDFIEEKLLPRGISVVSLTHIHEKDKGLGFNDTSFGAFKRNGGILSTHDEASMLEVVGGEYRITHRGNDAYARTLLTEEELPSEQSANDFNLLEHLKLLESKQNDVSEFSMG